MFENRRRCLPGSLVALACLTAGCGGAGSVRTFRLPMAGPWTTGAADFTAETAPPDAVVRTELLPAPFSGNGVLLEGTNRSDDLLLFAAQSIEALPPSTDFLAAIDVEIVTDTPTGCAGVGGSPGDSVWIVAG